MESNVTISKITEDIWQFNEANENGPYVDAYLICGKNRALLVDALQTVPNLYDLVRERTSLPLEVVLTHGHGDHAGVSLEGFRKGGCSIYMDLRDIPVLAEFQPTLAESNCFIPAEAGKKFDLGGYCFEIISIPGHTPGCLVLLEEGKQLLFSGDSVGSGMFWMQLPACLPLSSFCKELEAFWLQIKPLGNLLIYPGHRNQSPLQLRGQYVQDVLAVTRGVLSGELRGKPAEMNWRGGSLHFARLGYGLVGEFCYDPQRL